MRPQPLYSFAQGRSNLLRHLMRATGEGGFPRALCQDGIALRDDSELPPCRECRLVALTEIALALDSMGLQRLSVKVASEARLASYETGGAMADA